MKPFPAGTTSAFYCWDKTSPLIIKHLQGYLGDAYPGGYQKSPWLHHIFGWMKCHHWLSVSYKLISAIDGDAITNYGMVWYPSLTARQTVNAFVLTRIALPPPDDTKKENHVQAYAPWGAHLSGAKPVHEENCQGIKLRIAHKIKRLNSRL